MNDFRFLRLWWEPVLRQSGTSDQGSEIRSKWVTISKGGSFSRYYIDWELVLNWDDDGREIKEHVAEYRGRKGWGFHWAAALNGYTQYFRPGLTWPRRSQKGLSIRVLPAGAIFGDKGPTIFVPANDKEQLLKLLALTNSSAFFALVRLQMAFGSYEVGVLEQTPIPDAALSSDNAFHELAHRAWYLKRTLDTVEENSHAFLLPAVLRNRLGEFCPATINLEMVRIQAEIDETAFKLYGFSEVDRAAATQPISAEIDENVQEGDDEEDEVIVEPVNDIAALLSWSVGVAFSRFDWRLATGERLPHSEPDPFDPLPSKSFGMLPDGAIPFHVNAGVLVDDPGHAHDLVRVVEEVLVRVKVNVPDDVRRWLQRDLFALHLRSYSKSRRKAPIYWPLSTPSGNYTLWIYYPSLNNQTLFTAVNDFLDGPNGKLTQVNRECTELRGKGSGRSRNEENQYELLQIFAKELTDLRDSLLKIASVYQPSHEDGVQITAAPLWPLFRHKQWQKVLKETWTKLEKGDCDWAHLAMAYWPERVREKCKTDKSLAIAHGLEELYVETEATPKKTRTKKKAGAGE